MSILGGLLSTTGSTLTSALASKGAATLGAAVLMVGGGVAIAQTGNFSPATSAAQDEPDPEGPAPGDPCPPDEVPPEEGAENGDEGTDVEAPEEGEGAETPEEGDTTGDATAAGNGEVEGEPCPPEEGPADENGENGETPVVEDVEGGPDPEGPGEEEGLEEGVPEDEGPDEDGDEGSTSERVHRALTGDAVDEDGEAIRPGHPDFGATVSNRARMGHLGSIVSRAARGDADWEDHLDIDEEAEDDDASNRSGEGDSTDDEPATNGESAGTQDDRSGPPAHARENRGGGPPEHAREAQERRGPPPHAGGGNGGGNAGPPGPPNR